MTRLGRGWQTVRRQSPTYPATLFKQDHPRLWRLPTCEDLRPTNSSGPAVFFSIVWDPPRPLGDEMAEFAQSIVCQPE